MMNKIVLDRKLIDNDDVMAVMEKLDYAHTVVDYEISRSRLVIDFSEFEDEMSVFEYLMEELSLSMEDALMFMSESREGGYDYFVEDVKNRFAM